MLILRAAAVAAILSAGAVAVDKGDVSGARRSGRGTQGDVKAPALRVLATITSAADLTGKGGGSESAKPLRLLKPQGLAIDSAGRIFVADPVQHSVLVFDRQARTAVRWTGNARHALAGPAGLALRADGRLFVTDAYAARVVVFDSAGNAVRSFGRGHLKRPAGIALDAARGRIYVADSGLRQVVIFDDRNFSFSGTVGAGAAKAKASAPTNLAVNSRGVLYVTHPAECQVRMYGPDGTLGHSFRTDCVHPGEFTKPSSIAIGSEDRLYIADAELGSVQVFAADGKAVLFAGSAGRGPKGPVMRTAMALDREGRIYVGEQDTAGGTVRIFDAVPEQSRQLRAGGDTQAQR